eukprot:NODE_313_length_11219_cov_0.287770.p7 type:complete len:112 gc:universal NODE_313_length_11219_cov_0.287770:5677-5342(-)
MYKVWYSKETNLDTIPVPYCHLEIDRDHMAAKNIYIKYMHPYSIPPQGSENVSFYCNGASSIASFCGNSRFSRKSGILTRILFVIPAATDRLLSIQLNKVVSSLWDDNEKN